MDNLKKDPVSLKTLVRQAEAEEAEAKRPKFLSREEREKLALQKLHSKREQQMAASGMALSSTLTFAEEQMIKERHHFSGDTTNPASTRKMDRKLRFDWEAQEDTMNGREDDPLYAAIKPVASRASSKPVFRNLDDRHWSEKRLEEMSERDWRIFREDFNISVSGIGGVREHPIRYWPEMAAQGAPRRLVDLLMDAGYEDPTPIQRQVIPLALAGRDLIGLAETGSGKTLAFLLPIMANILSLPRMDERRSMDGPYALIMVPTRELAQQIEKECRKFCGPLRISSVTLVGGHSVAEQSFSMRNGVEIVIGTPGRLRDFLEQHLLVFNQCVNVVLDEADRMIDMNFEEDLDFIIQSFPPETVKQMMMFSATMPASVERLAKTYMRKPTATVSIGQVGVAVETVEQRIEMLPDDYAKLPRLSALLQDPDTAFPPPIIVFVNQKRTVDYVSTRLEALGFKVAALHGGKGQEQREAAIAAMRSGYKNVLVATDVAGRGIDIPNVSLVLNFDMAKSIEDYIHRIGRTGRAGKTGTAITFLTPSDTEMYYDLRVCMQRSPLSKIPHDLAMHEAARTKPGQVQQKRRQEETIAAFGV